MQYTNKLEEYLDLWFSNENPETRIKILTHYIFSRENNIDESKYSYINLLNFCNNENYPSIIIYDEEEDDKLAQLFYVANSEEDVKDIIKKNKIFIDNLKSNTLNKDVLYTKGYINLINKLFENNVTDYELIIIYNDYLQDQKIIAMEDYFFNDPNIFNYCELKIIDKKRLNSKFLGEILDENQQEGNKFNFEFKNPSNMETGKNNAIIYQEANVEKTIILSLSAKSLISCYHKFNERIFDKNVRFAITKGTASKSVDDSIRETVKNNPGKFFIFNNGVTIVSEKIGEIDILNNLVSLKNFSIVNGAQTITNLEKINRDSSMKDNIDKVYVVAKIIEVKDENQDDLVEKITKASNNQKPITPRDLKSNAKEMIALKEFFKENNVILNVKRGDQALADKKYIAKRLGINDVSKIPSVLNDQVAQYVYSLILMNPTFSLQNKSKIFNEKNYEKIFLNKSVSHEDIFLSYSFYSKVSKLLTELNNYIIFGDIEGVQPLIGNINSWVISLIWLIWNIKDSLGTIVNYKSLETFKNVKGTFVNKTINDEFEFNKDELASFMYNCYEIIYKMYLEKKNKKGELFSHSAFSYKEEFYQEFIKEVFKIKIISELERKVRYLSSIFK